MLNIVYHAKLHFVNIVCQICTNSQHFAIVGYKKLRPGIICHTTADKKATLGCTPPLPDFCAHKNFGSPGGEPKPFVMWDLRYAVR